MSEVYFNSRRIDGRQPCDLRKIDCSLGKQSYDGYAYLTQGNTKVIACVEGVKSAKRYAESNREHAVIQCVYQRSSMDMASNWRQVPPSATQSSTSHSSNKLFESKAKLLQDIFTSAILLHHYPRREINIFVNILQSDGSELSVAINAVTMALTDAGVEMQDFVCGVTVGLVDEVVLLDLNSFEESNNIPQLTVAMLPNRCLHNRSATDENVDKNAIFVNSIVYCDLTQWLHVSRLPSMMTYAQTAVCVLHNRLNEILHERMVRAYAHGSNEVQSVINEN